MMDKYINISFVQEDQMDGSAFCYQKGDDFYQRELSWEAWSSQDDEMWRVQLAVYFYQKRADFYRRELSWEAWSSQDDEMWRVQLAIYKQNRWESWEMVFSPGICGWLVAGFWYLLIYSPDILELGVRVAVRSCLIIAYISTYSTYCCLVALIFQPGFTQYICIYRIIHVLCQEKNTMFL